MTRNEKSIWAAAYSATLSAMVMSESPTSEDKSELALVAAAVAGEHVNLFRQLSWVKFNETLKEQLTDIMTPEVRDGLVDMLREMKDEE